MDAQYTVIFSADKIWYAVKELAKGIWLGVETVTPPIPDGFKRPDVWGAAIMPGRPYWRRFTALRQTPGAEETRIADDELVADYRDAAWWTPGINEPEAEVAPVMPDGWTAEQESAYQAAIANLDKLPESPMRDVIVKELDDPEVGRALYLKTLELGNLDAPAATSESEPPAAKKSKKAVK